MPEAMSSPEPSVLLHKLTRPTGDVADPQHPPTAKREVFGFCCLSAILGVEVVGVTGLIPNFFVELWRRATCLESRNVQEHTWCTATPCTSH